MRLENLQDEPYWMAQVQFHRSNEAGARLNCLVMTVRHIGRKKTSQLLRTLQKAIFCWNLSQGAKHGSENMIVVTATKVAIQEQPGALPHSRQVNVITFCKLITCYNSQEHIIFSPFPLQNWGAVRTLHHIKELLSFYSWGVVFVRENASLFCFILP